MNTLVGFSSLKRKTISLILFVFFMAVLVSGCGGSNNTSVTPAPAAKPAPAELPKEVGGKNVLTIDTAYYIDIIAGNTHTEKPVTIAKGSLISIGGWAVDSSRKVTPKTIYIKLTPEAGGKEYYIKAERSPRPDVAKTHNNNEYASAGFNVGWNTKEVAPGTYKVGILQIDDAQAVATVTKAKIVVQ